MEVQVEANRKWNFFDITTFGPVYGIEDILQKHAIQP